jgi:hypothetical protein
MDLLPLPADLAPTGNMNDSVVAGHAKLSTESMGPRPDVGREGRELHLLVAPVLFSPLPGVLAASAADGAFEGRLCMQGDPAL